jgi:hypothetical protein
LPGRAAGALPIEVERGRGDVDRNHVTRIPDVDLTAAAAHVQQASAIAGERRPHKPVQRRTDDLVPAEPRIAP